jgi:hypothetical protein
LRREIDIQRRAAKAQICFKLLPSHEHGE